MYACEFTVAAIEAAVAEFPHHGHRTSSEPSANPSSCGLFYLPPLLCHPQKFSAPSRFRLKGKHHPHRTGTWTASKLPEEWLLESNSLDWSTTLGPQSNTHTPVSLAPLRWRLAIDRPSWYEPEEVPKARRCRRVPCP